MDARAWLEGLPYRLGRALLTPAVRVYFRRIEVLHADRLPEHGPVLVVANHPCSLTDVLVLGVTLGRRMRFLGFSGLFRPRPLGALLRLWGAIPIYRTSDAARETHRNAEAFAAVHRAWDRGQAVAMFPEGDSYGDRTVAQLKTGAARLALGYESDPARRGRLVVAPIGLHFSARDAFRSDVTLAVGRPIDLGPFVELCAKDERQAVSVLTARIREALIDGILHVPDPSLEPVVADLLRLRVHERWSQAPDTRLWLLQSFVRMMAHLRRRNPVRLERIAGQLRAYQASLREAGLSDDLLERPPARSSIVRERLRLLALGLAGGPLALAGLAIHGLPYHLSAALGRRLGNDPTRISFVHIMAGSGLFAAEFAGIAWLLRTRLAWTWPAVLAALAACVVLGLFTLACVGWLRRERHRLRLALLVASEPGRVRTLRERRQRVQRELVRARREYLAETGRAAGRSVWDGAEVAGGQGRKKNAIASSR